jgi:hypothetical protein
MTAADQENLFVKFTPTIMDKNFTIRGVSHIADEVRRVWLVFFYSWEGKYGVPQWGQGCIYFNGLILPMFMSKFVQANGIDKYDAALRLMHAIEDLNGGYAIDKLQLTWRELKYNNQIYQQPRNPSEAYDLPPIP